MAEIEGWVRCEGSVKTHTRLVFPVRLEVNDRVSAQGRFTSGLNPLRMDLVKVGSPIEGLGTRCKLV